MKKVLFFAIAILCSINYLFAQIETPFNGLVTDANGKGFKARISVKDSDQFTFSNKEGKFGLTNVAADATLVLSYKKYEVEVPVAGRSSIKITWVIGNNPTYAEDGTLLAAGPGYIKKREYSSGSSTISGEELVRRGYNNLYEAVVGGAFSGVQEANGMIVIRGRSSFSMSRPPLIICDGVEIKSLSSVNIHDVESVEVQKGANSYGVRGGHGVIVIRTKK